MSLSVGARLGHYTVTAKLGESGLTKLAWFNPSTPPEPSIGTSGPLSLEAVFSAASPRLGV